MDLIDGNTQDNTSSMSLPKSFLLFKDRVIKYSKSEFSRYLISGITITLVNVFLYTFLVFLGMKYHLANLISIIIAKVYAYLVNKLYVYKHKTKSFKHLCSEIFKFIMSRGLTGVLDYVLVIFAVEVLNINNLWAKYITAILIIILNYILGKKYVFRSKE